MSPRISVVLPTYNRAHIINDSIQSVLDQTYEDFELIIIDDGSTDDTENVVQSISDDRISFFQHDQNQGVAAARNTGIKQAKGDYIAFQDSDDTWKPSKLEKQIHAFDESPEEVGVVYTGIWRTVEGVKKYLPPKSLQNKEGDIRSALEWSNFIPGAVAMVRQQCFDDVGVFDERTPPIDDWELWLRISNEFEFKLVDEPLVIAEVHSDSISRNQQDKVESRKLIVEKHKDEFHSDALAKQMFYVGHGFMKLGQAKSGRKFLIQAIKHNPRLVYVGSLGLSLFGSGLYNMIYRLYSPK